MVEKHHAPVPRSEGLGELAGAGPRSSSADDRVTVVAWWICYAFFRSKTEALPAAKDLADAELEGSELRTSVTRWL